VAVTRRDHFGSELRVLIADDEPDVRLLLRLGLRHRSISVVGEAADGLEVLERCNEIEVDALVLDLLMPRMNGFEVIPELQRDHPQIGVVAYTAVAGDFVRREMSRLHIPLLLKSGDSAPLADALHGAAASAQARLRGA
jgi:two-component system, NarL family, nitrate/nitrite response regulator NarL